jgi:flagellar basal-body rod protein FlgG
MIRSLYSAATGMISQQKNIDTISNNIANANTAGFKKNRAEFTDLIYQNMKYAGTSTSTTTISPTGIQIGLGSKLASTAKIFEIGSLKETGNDLDIAITGEGFFAITLPDGSEAYTKNGSFKINGDGSITTSEGYLLSPQITIPANVTDINISEDGMVSVLEGNSRTPAQVGQILLSSFVNQAGLHAMGGTMFQESVASGAPIAGIAGTNGLGQTRQGFIELSNVKLVNEMTDLIAGQRAYEANSKAITTSDEMLQTVNQLKR